MFRLQTLEICGLAWCNCYQCIHHL